MLTTFFRLKSNFLKKIFLIGILVYSEKINAFSNNSFNDLIALSDSKEYHLVKKLENVFYEAVTAGFFDGSYPGSLIFVEKEELSLDDYNNFFYTLLSWLEHKEDALAVTLRKLINKIYHQEIHHFLCTINNNNPKITKSLGIFHTLSSFKRDNSHEHLFRTTMTKCILALQSLDQINNKHAEKKVQAYALLEKCKKALVALYQELSLQEKQRIVITEKEISHLIRSLELYGLRPPLAQSKTFHYVAGATAVSVVVYLAVKYVPWEDIGHWIRDRIIYPSIDGVAAHVRDNFVYSDPQRRIVHHSFADLINSMFYIQRPDENNPGQMLREIRPAFREALESVIYVHNADGTRAVNPMFREAIEGALYVEVEHANDDGTVSRARVLSPALQQASAELSATIAQSMLRGLAPEEMQNPTITQLSNHVSNNIVRGIISGLDPQATDETTASDVVNQLARQLRRTITAEGEDTLREPLAQHLSQQIVRGLLPENTPNPSIDTIADYISERVINNIVTGIAPEAMNDPTFERAMNHYTQQIRSGVRAEGQQATEQVANFIRSFPGGRFIAGSPQQQGSGQAEQNSENPVGEAQEPQILTQQPATTTDQAATITTETQQTGSNTSQTMSNSQSSSTLQATTIQGQQPTQNLQEPQPTTTRRSRGQAGQNSTTITQRSRQAVTTVTIPRPASTQTTTTTRTTPSTPSTPSGTVTRRSSQTTSQEEQQNSEENSGWFGFLNYFE